jgi:hypothetical protein
MAINRNRKGDRMAERIEKMLLASGIAVGKNVDIRTLAKIADQQKVEVILFFEEPLAREEDFGAVRERFAEVPEFERPFVRVQAFLRFAAGSDPTFMTRLKEFPLRIAIVGFGEYREAGRSVPVVKGLMPFLGEIDFDSEMVPGQD